MNALRGDSVVLNVQENDHTLIDGLDIRHEDRQAWVAGLKKRVFSAKTISSVGRAATAANKNDNNNSNDRVHSIYRIPPCIREVNPDAYEPRVMSLGPYNCHKPHLQAMNKLKWCYFRRFLRRNPEKDLDNYLALVEERESQVRGAYSELEPSFHSKELVQMMLLDCCFVLEFLLLNDVSCEEEEEEEEEEEVDPNENITWAMPFLIRDMLLLENQLPFFLLEELLKLNIPHQTPSLPQIVWRIFSEIMPGMIRSMPIDISSDDSVPIHHILHLMHTCATPILVMEEYPKLSPQASLSCLFKMFNKGAKKFTRGARIFQRHIPICHLDNDSVDLVAPEEQPLRWFPSAVKLREVGVVFKRKRNYASFLDITFDRGVLEIPPLQIYGYVNSVLHNLITFEQCHTTNFGTYYFSSYAYLMNFMVDTVADVQMLDREGILTSTLDSDDDVVILFKRLRKNTVVDSDGYLNSIVNSIQIHCNKRTSRLKAMLIQNWEIISVAAGTFLFVLSIIQTILAFFSYLRPISA